MDDWHRLLEDLETDGPFDRERTDELKAKIKRESELKQKKWLIALTLYCLLGLAVLLVGGMVVRDSEDIRFMFLGSVVMIIGFEITILVKLGYGTLFSLAKVLETVREVQISIIEHLDASAGGRHDKEVES